jgi:hypothetical protein
MACGCPMVCFQLPIFMDMVRKNAIRGALFATNNKAFAAAILTLALEDYDGFEVIDIAGQEMPNYGTLSIEAYEWAQQFDYKKQSLRVWHDICAVLNLAGIGR